MRMQAMSDSGSSFASLIQYRRKIEDNTALDHERISNVAFVDHFQVL